MGRWTGSDLDCDSVDLEEWTCVLSPKLRLSDSDSEDLLELLLEVDYFDGSCEDGLHGLHSDEGRVGRDEAKGHLRKNQDRRDDGLRLKVDDDLSKLSDRGGRDRDEVVFLRIEEGLLDGS